MDIQQMISTWNWNEFLAVFITLFAVIDILGNIPILISLQEKMGHIRAFPVVLLSGFLMMLFFFTGRSVLHLFGLSIYSFAVGGSIVIFLLGLEMVMGREIFKGDDNPKAGTFVPISFPLIAGSGTLTTLMSLKATYEKGDKNEFIIFMAILANLVVIFIVLKSLRWFQKVLGPLGMVAMRKFFGVILIAISVQIFAQNIYKVFN